MNAKTMTMTMALAVAAAAVVQAVQIPFDEGVGLYADAKGSEAFAELSPTVKWARGSFGAAIATGEKDAVAMCARKSHKRRLNPQPPRRCAGAHNTPMGAAPS